MKTMTHKQTLQSTNWASTCCARDPIMKQWLVNTYRLSDTIKATMGDCQIDVCSQNWDYLTACESSLINHSKAWVRQVLLYGDNRVVAFGRTIASDAMYKKLGLDSLGDQPIGPQILFQHTQLERSPFEYKTLTAHDDYYQMLNNWTTLDKQSILHARRSRFTLQNEACEPLLLVEVFLPLDKPPVTMT